MSSDSEPITDEALASRISDDGRLSSEFMDSAEEGFVEAGIPPQASDAEGDDQLGEEPFSVNDFDSDISLADSSSSPDAVFSAPTEESSIDDAEDAAPSFQRCSPPISSEAESLPNGQVSEFRKTLSALSRQLEVDRLTFLYQQLHAQGGELPSLERIASDIRGDSPMHPLGDDDLYSKRPLARLQGWISGLSFGVGRRAKKFCR